LSDRNIDSEATREVATNDVPALADAYEHLEQLIVDAGGYLDTSGISEEMATDFTDYHLLLRNAVVESRQNYEDLAGALEQIADDDERTEGEIAATLGALADETESGLNAEGYTTMVEGQYGDSLTEAPSEFDKHLAPERETRGDGVAL
jgi:hypothetical protein